MSTRWRVFKRLILTTILALLGAVVGGCAGAFLRPYGGQPEFEFLAEDVPLPHHVPKYRGGLSFRFAMAHDVIHERYPRYGMDHYRKRNQIARDRLARLPADDSARWPVIDDLAAGLDRVGKSAQAVDLMREKQNEQRRKNVSGRDHYTTWANLGTFLIHANFRGAMAGEADSIQRFEEGVRCIRNAVEVNPEAHFGREQWQAAIAEFLLAVIRDPELSKKFDCLGNRLDRSPPTFKQHDRTYGHAAPGTGWAEIVAPLARDSANLGNAEYWEQLRSVRETITEIGDEFGWDKVDVPSHRQPVPFDEPMLGIIGMWRQGGGANPHFALSIADTMLRVGQPYIAWTAYERASRLAERYSPQPELQQFLVSHCRERQTGIEIEVGATADDLRTQFDSELAYGQSWQAKHAHPELRDTISEEQSPIATAPGSEEFYRVVTHERRNTWLERRTWSLAIFGAGIGSCLPILWAALVMLLNVRRTQSQP